MASSSKSNQYTAKTNNALTKDCTVFVGLIVDKVLDVETLHRAAKELITQWPILGGDLITNTNPYSGREGKTVDFNSRTISKSRQEFFPLDFQHTNTESPTYVDQPGGRSCEYLFHFDSVRPLNLVPKSMLAIRVTVLEDATLLGFRVPHYLSDSESLFEIISSYTKILSNKTISRLLPPPDAEQPLSTLLKADAGVRLPSGMTVENTPYLHTSEFLVVGLLGWLLYVIDCLGKMLKTKMLSECKSEEKFIYLPRELVEKWREECQKELDNEGSGSGDLALSKLDVVTAWFLQATYKSHPPTSTPGPIDLMYTFSYRFAVPSPAKGTTYLKSSQYELRTHWSSLSSFRSSTHALLASRIRATVLRSKQASVIKENLEFQEKNARSLLAPGAEGVWLDRLPVVSSWCREAFWELDFSDAISMEKKNRVRDGDGDGEKAKVVFVMPKIALPMGIVVDPFAIVLKDGEGGYWLRANLSRGGWKGHGVDIA